MIHKDDCKFLRAVQCAVGIECEHGYDVCPICDKCECPRDVPQLYPKTEAQDDTTCSK